MKQETNNYLTTVDAPSRLVGLGVKNLTPGAFIALSGDSADPLLLRRKTLIVSHDDKTHATIVILDQNGNTAAIVHPSETVQIETSEPVTVQNIDPNTTIGVCIGESWWLCE